MRSRAVSWQPRHAAAVRETLQRICSHLERATRTASHHTTGMILTAFPLSNPILGIFPGLSMSQIPSSDWKKPGCYISQSSSLPAPHDRGGRGGGGGRGEAPCSQMVRMSIGASHWESHGRRAASPISADPWRFWQRGARFSRDAPILRASPSERRQWLALLEARSAEGWRFSGEASKEG
jgi:hypothetical protein